MHQPEDVNITYIPHDFKVACTLFGLPIPRLLQLFIDHVSLYDLFCETEIGPYNLATRTLTTCHHEKNKNEEGITKPPERNISEEDSNQSVKLIQSMIALSLKPKLNDKQRRKRARPWANQLHQYIGNMVVKSTTLYLNEEDTLRLTNDFCFICELENIHPIEHLTYFMEQISLADHYARAGLGKLIENSAMAFFFETSRGYGSIHYEEVSHQATKIAFIDEIQEMHLNLFIYRSLDYRRTAYQNLLDKYYNQIIERE